MSTQAAAVLIAAIAPAGYIAGAYTVHREPQSKRSATPPRPKNLRYRERPRQVRGRQNQLDGRCFGVRPSRCIIAGAAPPTPVDKGV